MQFRPCEDCEACCSGALLGISYGNKYGDHHACRFLVDKKCSIYTNRPKVCEQYQCAYTQHLLPLNMKPNTCGVIVSVEKNQNGQQYLKAIQIWQTVAYSTWITLEECAQKLETYLEKVPYKCTPHSS